jgi:methylmalonyl-CoA epimerase
MALALDHIGIAVRSLAAAKQIYEKLGFPLSPEENVPAEKVRVVMVPIGDTRLELLEPTSDESVIARFIAKHGEGMHHISIRVPDLHAAVQKMKSAGTRLVSDEIKTGAGGHRYVFLHPSASNGVLIELVEA